jgi:hypothetical protein
MRTSKLQSTVDLVHAASARAFMGAAHPDSWDEIRQDFRNAIVKHYKLVTGRTLTEKQLKAIEKSFEN